MTQWSPLEVDEVAVNQPFVSVEDDAKHDRHIGTPCKVLFSDCGAYRPIPRRAAPVHHLYAQPLRAASRGYADHAEDVVNVRSGLGEVQTLLGSRRTSS
jgi:hypothetical protein